MAEQSFAHLVVDPSGLEPWADRLVITRLLLEQEIHHGFHGVVELRSNDDLAERVMGLRGEIVTLVFDDEPLLPSVRALVSAVRLLVWDGGDNHAFELAVRSPAELLRQSRRQRIFHGTRTQNIVRRVFEDYPGLVAPRFSGTSGVSEREYVVQYGESDWDFVRRLLADDGMALITDPASDGVLCTDHVGAGELGTAEVPFRGASRLDHGSAPAVESAWIEGQLVPEAVVVRAYDESRPALQLEGRHGARQAGFLPLAGGAARPQREWYEFETHAFASASDSAARAQQLREELTREEERVVCRTTFSYPAGALLSITGAPRELPAKLIAVRVRTELSLPPGGAVGALPTRQSTVETVPLGPFRPARLPKPRIHGSQTGFVRGGPGQEIDVDALGRIEVEFPWDRRDSRSAGSHRRIRLAHGWAGGSYGIGAVPRVGDEVVVSFLDGDPDEPLVVGRVHNGAAPGPLKLPEEKAHTVWRTQSTNGAEGFNEMRMVDDAGQELVRMHAQRDFELVALKDARRFVGAADSQFVGGPQDITVRDKKFETVHKGEARNIGTGSATQVHGPVTIDATTWLLTADERADVIGGPWSSHAASYSFDAGGGPFDLFAGPIEVNGETIHLQAGGCDLMMDGGVLTLQVGSTMIQISDGKIMATSGGSSIVIDDGTITQISPLIDLNP